MLRVLELFGGIGACSKALERLGIEFEIADYVEIDKYAVKSFNAIRNTNFSPQDICQWDKDIEVDLIMHGSPCQDFSLAGKNKGGDEGSGTRSSLMYETLRIVDKLKPKYVIWENVRNLLSAKHKHNFDKYLARMQELGYTSHYDILNTKDFGIPQNRERVFTISIRNDLKQGFIFPQKQELKLRLKDLLENNVDEKYYLLSEKQEKLFSVLNKRGDIEKYNKNTENGGVLGTIYADMSLGGSFETGICPLSRTLKASRYDTCVIIKTNTKKGYQKASVGDSINLSYPNSKTRRGRIGKGVAQTLDTHCEQGVVIDYDEQNRYLRTDGTIGTITTDGSSPKQNNREIEMLKEIKRSDILTDKPNIYAYDGYNNKVKKDGIIGTVVPQNSRWGITNGYKIIRTTPYNLTIRKLTPKECWRLQGFDDSDFAKAAAVQNYDTQLYKQAGNSITVNVLEAVLTQLLLKQTPMDPIEQQLNLFDMLQIETYNNKMY